MRGVEFPSIIPTLVRQFIFLHPIILPNGLIRVRLPPQITTCDSCHTA